MNRVRETVWVYLENDFPVEASSSKEAIAKAKETLKEMLERDEGLVFTVETGWRKCSKGVRPSERYCGMLRDLCNVDMHLQDEVTQDIPNWHRAMQAVMFRFVLKVLRVLAGQEYYDGRNAHAVLAARAMLARYEEWRKTSGVEPYVW